MNSASFTTLLLLLAVVPACAASDAGSVDTDTDTEGATGDDSEADPVDPGFRILFPIGEWGIESGYMMVEGGPGGLSPQVLPLPESVDTSALKRSWSRMSSDGRWAHVCFEHENDTDIGVLYSLAGPTGSEPTMTDLGPQLCSHTVLPFFVDSGQAAFFPEASEGLWAIELGADAGTPVHLDTPAGGPSAQFKVRPGTSEVLIYHGDSMWWHPGLPVDVLPILVADGWLWGVGQGAFAPRFIDRDRVLLWRDGQALVATLVDGTLRDIVEIPAPTDERCDEPIYLSGVAAVTGETELNGIVCRPGGAAPYVVDLKDPAAEPWILHDSAWNLDQLAASSDGRWLAVFADYPDDELEREDGLYLVDRMTRGTPELVPAEYPPRVAAFCDGHLFASREHGLLHADLDSDAPQLAVVEAIDERRWETLDPRGGLCLPELRRFVVVDDREGLVAIDLDTLDVDVLAEVEHENEVVSQVQLAPDGSTLTYFRDEPWCDEVCPASLTMIDLVDDSMTDLELERVPKTWFPVSMGPIAR